MWKDNSYHFKHLNNMTANKCHICNLSLTTVARSSVLNRHVCIWKSMHNLTRGWGWALGYKIYPSTCTHREASSCGYKASSMSHVQVISNPERDVCTSIPAFERCKFSHNEKMVCVCENKNFRKPIGRGLHTIPTDLKRVIVLILIGANLFHGPLTYNLNQASYQLGWRASSPISKPSMPSLNHGKRLFVII